ncbi:MAG: S41 family peptidase [Ruminococcaceae bacterium]|nr:S41 family peptidase [Oscillospiraceae bacterium]
MKNDKLTRVLSYVVVALLSVTLTVAVMLSIFVFGNQGQTKLEYLENLILQCFIGDVDKTAIEDAAANAMVGALGDRWSYYIPADQYTAHMEQVNNSYVGIGITVQAGEDGSILVVQVAAGGPAEEAGLQAGDAIIKVANQSVIGMSLNDSKKLIQGEENTKVTLTVLRNEEELTVEVTRRRIESPVAEGKMLEDGIGLVTIYNFNSKCASESIAAIENLMAQGAQKLIFDVRNNPGGYAHELVALLDYLLPEGKLFTTVDYSGKENTDWSDAKCLDIPMAVLVNGSSYSAAEFFAAAMSEYEAAAVVGEKTVGKGYFQSTFRLPDGSAVGLSIGEYFTPKGENLANVGITPDLPVEPAEETVTQPMDDPQILAAVEYLRAK